MIILENGEMKVSIAAKGAELQSIYNKVTQLEYLWNGDPGFWPRRSPVLFPLVGSVLEDTYVYKNASYHLPRHGFARDKEFVSEKVSDTEAVFTLTDDAESLLVYPFQFTLKLRYTLSGDTVTCQYEVINSGKEVLLFSVGAHPAFSIPLVKGTDYTDYYLQWNQPETLVRWIQEGGYSNTKTEVLPTDNGQLPLKHSLFYDDALVLKNLQSDCISILSTQHSHGIDFKFSQFPYFGIWASKDAPFVCLEPWCGITDNITHNKQFEEKEGIERLGPGGQFIRSWSVSCF